MRTNLTRRRLWVLRLSLLAGAVLLAGVLAEVALRILGVSYPNLTKRDDFRGTAYRPHLEWIQSGEGYAHVRTNGEGFRDDEWTVDKPPGTVRIAVLGDSYVDALQVEEPDRFTERLGDELASCPPVQAAHVEVMNFGESGYGTAQEYMTYRHHVAKYAPDVVVLAFLPHNDLRNNSLALQRDPGRPYFVLQDGHLVFDDSFRETSFHEQPWWKRVVNGARDYLRLFQLAHNVRRALQRRAEGELREAVATDLRPRAHRSEIGLDDMSYLEPRDPLWQQTWAATEAMLAALNDEVRANGAGFMVMALTAGDQVHPDPGARREFAEALGVETLLYADRRLARLGAKEGFPVVTLASAFQDYAESHGVHLHGFDRPGSGHWNQRGHRLAAQLLAAGVCENWETLIEGDVS